MGDMRKGCPHDFYARAQLMCVDCVSAGLETARSEGYAQGHSDAVMEHAARTLAIMETVTGTLYLAILISRLVGRYSSAAQTDLPQNSDKP